MVGEKSLLRSQWRAVTTGRFLWGMEAESAESQVGGALVEFYDKYCIRNKQKIIYNRRRR